MVSRILDHITNLESKSLTKTSSSSTSSESEADKSCLPPELSVSVFWLLSPYMCLLIVYRILLFLLFAATYNWFYVYFYFNFIMVIAINC